MMSFQVVHNCVCYMWEGEYKDVKKKINTKISFNTENIEKSSILET